MNDLWHSFYVIKYRLLYAWKIKEENYRGEGRERIAESVTPFVAGGVESPAFSQQETSSTGKYVEEKGEEKGEEKEEEKGEEEEGNHNNQVQGWEEKMEEEKQLGSSEKTERN